MKFDNWLEQDETMQLEFPNPRHFAYIGCVLHKASQDRLFSALQQQGVSIPAGWVKRGHHMTCKFKPTSEDFKRYLAIFGTEVELTVNQVWMDDNAIAVGVQSKMQVPQPHITVAHRTSVMPSYSVTLLSSGPGRPLNNIFLMSYLLAVKHEQTFTWPEVPASLASPSLIA